MSARVGFLAALFLVLAACGPSSTPAVTSVPSSVPTDTPPPSASPTGTPTATSSSSTPPSGFVRIAGEPDYTMTPGVLNPAVSPATIGSTICVSGWTATVRPPVSYTDPLKVKQIGLYGYADTNVADYEEDHLIPLELGGSPTSPANLWPEPRTIAYSGRDVSAAVKDGLENLFKTQVCVGTLTLAAAQEQIGDHWVHHFLGVAP